MRLQLREEALLTACFTLRMSTGCASAKRSDLLARGGGAHELADLLPLHDDLAPLSERLTQHGLRRTYKSLRIAIGRDQQRDGESRT